MASPACAVCGRGPAGGTSIFRMNAKGQPGLWACNEHKDQFDARVPEDVMQVVRTLEGKDHA